MLDALISSKTRVKLLLKFFLNRQSKAYLRQLEEEFGESTNGIRLELNKFEKAGMLQSSVEGNKKWYQVNTQHSLYPELRSIVMKYVGLDRIVEDVAKQLGELQKVYLIGDYAKGIDSGVIDLAVIGKVDESYLLELVRKAEEMIDRKVRYLLFESVQSFQAMENREGLLLWAEEGVR